jgi:regulatory protein
MPKVTDIKQQQKRKERYSIYFDGKYLLSLSQNELMKSGIRVGAEYQSEQLEELKQTAVLDKAYMRSLDYLARRSRSRWEMADYLKRKDYGSPTVDIILNKLSDMQYLDDEKFARSWLDNRRLLKPTSLRRLKQELQQKRVPAEIISKVLEGQEDAEQQALQEQITKKLRLSRFQDREKLIAYLMRQGFRYDDIKSALSQVTD